MAEFITGTTAPKPKRPDQELALLDRNGDVIFSVFPLKPCPAKANTTWGEGSRSGLDDAICTGACFGCGLQEGCTPHNNYKTRFPLKYARHQILEILKLKP